MHPLTFFPFSKTSQNDELLPGTRFLFSSSLISPNSMFHVSLDSDPESEGDTLVLYCGSETSLRQGMVDLNHADEYLASHGGGGTPSVLHHLERVQFKCVLATNT